MDFIKRLLLIFALTTIFTLNSGYCSEVNYKKDCTQGTISAPKILENDFLNSKDNELSLGAINNNQTQLTSRRNQDNQGGFSNYHAIISKKQTENLITYIQNQTYLENNSELALLFLFHQIQPNAP